MPDIEGVPYETTGTPLDQASAQALAARNREAISAGVAAGTEAKALAQSVVSEVGTIRTAVVQSANSASAAAGSAAQAQQTADALVPRMEQIETMAGLAPGEVTDAQTANLISQDGTATRDALNAATVQSVRPRAISVTDYGSLDGDASATLAAAFADASGRRVLLPAAATLNVTQAVIRDISDATIDGNGATLNMVGTGPRTSALRIQGVVDSLTVENLRVKGDGTVANSHAGIVASGANTLRDLKIIGVTVEDVTLGISLAADGAGTLEGVLYQGCTVRNVVGTGSGYGYGLHVSISGTQAANVRMIGNTVKSAQRHAIYAAKGRGVSIVGNVILDHRDKNKDGTILPALMAARLSEATISANVIDRPAGGGLYIGGVGTGDHAENYIVTGNTLRDSQDAAVLAYIGQQDPATEGVPHSVAFSHNTLTNTESRGLLQVLNGIGLDISHNRFRVKGATNTTALTLTAVGNVGAQYMDRIAIENNLFEFAGAGAAIRFAPGHESHATAYTFRGNQRKGGTVMFAASGNVTNPNIDIQDQDWSGLPMAAGTSLAALRLFGPATTTAPGPGTAGALPALPAGYITVNIAGNDRRIPYYPA